MRRPTPPLRPRRGPRALLGGCALATIVAMALAPCAAFAASSGALLHVEAQDNYFSPDAIHAAVGTTIQWTNTGRSPHTVTLDDGSKDSGNLTPGATFSITFARPGAYPYYCRYHGAPGGIGMAGVILVGSATLPTKAGNVGAGREPVPTAPGRTLTVPQQFATIQEAVDAAAPGDLILVSPGVYHEAVTVTTPYLTIRGTDRNAVILDGDFTRPNGVHVIYADGVAVENMTARHYLLNGFFWTSVQGYHASYVTAYDDGDYGVYAFDSTYGRFDHSLASGHPDSGFYIGQCFPCHAVITDVLSMDNALGYSGTNAGGDLHIVNSVWRENMSGITPNTLDSEQGPPQRQVTIAGNLIEDNNNLDAPAKDQEYSSIGTGILLAGGIGNVVEHNTVIDNRNYGIATFPNLDQHFWIAQDNVVRGNFVRGSGRADLVLSSPAGKGNCFSGNDFKTSLPPAIQTLYGCGHNLHPAGGGDVSSAIQTLALYLRSKSGKYPQGDWRTVPAPPRQPSMPGEVTAAPELAVPGVSVPGPVPAIRTSYPVHPTGRQEVTVLGISLAAPTWWALLVATYAYLLPLMLLVAWVAIAVWDLVRQEAMANRRRIGWMIVILLVPFVGSILYFALGRSPIPRSVRTMLVAGGLGISILVTVVSALLGSA